jgi:hypothetical protein
MRRIEMEDIDELTSMIAPSGGAETSSTAMEPLEGLPAIIFNNLGYRRIN